MLDTVTLPVQEQLNLSFCLFFFAHVFSWFAWVSLTANYLVADGPLHLGLVHVCRAAQRMQMTEPSCPGRCLLLARYADTQL